MEQEQMTLIPSEEEATIQIEEQEETGETSPSEWENTATSPCERCADYLGEISSYISGDNSPLTTAGWIWVNLAMLITPLNLILLFLWAGGGTQRTNLKNYARGILLTAVLLALVFLAVVVIADLTGHGFIKL